MNEYDLLAAEHFGDQILGLGREEYQRFAGVLLQWLWAEKWSIFRQ